MKSKWGVLAGILVTVVFLVLAFYNVNLGQFWTCFSAYNVWWAVGSVTFFAGSVLFRALMWRVTTGHMGRTGLATLYGGVTVGYMANNLLPLRAGELIRPYYLSRKRGFPYAGVLSTVVIERVTDVVVLSFLLVGGLAAGLGGLDRTRGREAVLILLAVVLVLAVGLAALRVVGGRWRGAAGILGRVGAQVEHFAAPLRALGSGSRVISVVGLGVLAWLCNWLSMLVLLRGIAYQGSPWTTSLLLLLFVNLSVLIPSSPGSLGVMQLAFFAALHPFGVPKADALALSFIYQASIYVFTLGVGLPFFLQAHLKLSAMPGRNSSGVLAAVRPGKEP